MSQGAGSYSEGEGGAWKPMTTLEMNAKARHEASLKVPAQRGQQYQKAVKEALKRIKTSQARKVVKRSRESAEEDEDPDFEAEDDEIEEWVDEDDEESEEEEAEEEDEDDADDDGEDSAQKEIATYEQAMKSNEDVVRRGSTTTASTKVPLVRRGSNKSLGGSVGSLGSVSAPPKKRVAQPRNKKYAEVEAGPKVKRVVAPKKKLTYIQPSTSAVMAMEDCEGGVAMDIADCSNNLAMKPFLCHIGEDIFVKIAKFRSKWYLSIREFKDGKAQNRGINLELGMIRKLKAAIDAAVTHAKV